jgi:K+-sensing histidine kinase KdpD
MVARRRSSAEGYAAAVAAVGAVVAVAAVLAPFHSVVNPTTVALAFLLAVLFVGSRKGIGPALAASAAGMLCFNFFFLPPRYTLVIADPQNWIALASFLITAITAGQLAARDQRRADEAERRRLEIERLYDELRDAFERASRAEALRQSEQMKSALLDAVTHDLRTPLTAIKMSVTTLLEGTGQRPTDEAGQLGSEERTELLEVIDEETDRLDHSIGNLVELARIEAGRLPLRRRWTPLSDVVAEALDRLSRYAVTRTVVTRVGDDLPSVYVDGRALTEAVYILVDNATRYSGDGTEVTVTAREAEGGVELSVDDRGPGIPEHLRERVFEKFYRAGVDSGAGGEHPPGSGMGLAIARGIVGAHGGRVWMEGRDGSKGNRAMLWLPAGEESASEPLADAEVAARDTMRGGT